MDTFLCFTCQKCVKIFIPESIQCKKVKNSRACLFAKVLVEHFLFLSLFLVCDLCF